MVMVMQLSTWLLKVQQAGMIKTLGNGATFKNITFINAQARNFSGANDGILQVQ